MIPYKGTSSCGRRKEVDTWWFTESISHRHLHATPTHLAFYHKIPHLTHYKRSPTQQAQDGHGVLAFLLVGRLQRYLQLGRCHSSSHPTIRTNTVSYGVCPLTRFDSRPYMPSVQAGATIIEPWLQRCPNLENLHQHTFGSSSPQLGVLTTYHEKVQAITRETFVYFVQAFRNGFWTLHIKLT